MLVCLPSLAVVVSISLNGPNSSSRQEPFAVGDTVTIQVSGELAVRYGQAVGIQHSGSSSDTSNSLSVDGYVHSVSDDEIQIRHRRLVRRVGDVVRIVTLESTLSKAQMSAWSPDKLSFGVRRRVKLVDPRSAKIRSSMLRGDFPRYAASHGVLQ